MAISGTVMPSITTMNCAHCVQVSDRMPPNSTRHRHQDDARLQQQLRIEIEEDARNELADAEFGRQQHQ